jgi:hypothetical protein
MTFAKMFTRSQGKITSTDMPLNAKGYPTIGMLRPKIVPKTVVNPYISRCNSLEETAEMFETITEMTRYVIEGTKRDSANYENWSVEIYTKLFDYIDRDMDPTFDEIDAMLLVCRILLEHEMKDEITEFILNCPDKFLLTYANNSERSPAVFAKLRSLGLNNICKYMLPYVHYTKLGTWNERRNIHVRGNINFECSF